MTVENSQAEGQHEQYCARWMLELQSRHPLSSGGALEADQDCMGEEEEGAPACPPLSLPCALPCVQHAYTELRSLQTVHLPAGAGQTLAQLE